MKYFIICLALLVSFSSWGQTNFQVKPNSNIVILSCDDEYAFLGIYSDQLSKEKARKLGFDNPYGSYVTKVILNTAADRAGIQPLDYLYGIDEYRPGEHQSFTHIIRKFKPGENATVHLIRKGNKKSVPIVFGTREDAREKEKRGKCEDPFFGISAQSWDNKRIDGVPVSIVSNSTAKEIGMIDGDIITHINGHTIIDWKDVTIAIDNLEVGEKITVDIYRRNNAQQLSGRIKSYCETKNMKEEWEKKELEVAPNPGDWFGRYFSDEDESDDNRFISISVQELDQEDVEELRDEDNIALARGENLNIKNLTFSADARHDRFMLSFLLPSLGYTTIKVFNESGRMVYQYDLGDYRGTFEDEVDIAQNGDGTYYLEIKQDNKALVKRVIIEKD
ncbi:MAG: PDZ domain-containing protein [Chitinophagales bacterium]|nr:PDZ domain-containing protein [Chitinophagales bacterium]